MFSNGPCLVLLFFLLMRVPLCGPQEVRENRAFSYVCSTFLFCLKTGEKGRQKKVEISKQRQTKGNTKEHCRFFEVPYSLFVFRLVVSFENFVSLLVLFVSPCVLLNTLLFHCSVPFSWPVVIFFLFPFPVTVCFLLVAFFCTFSCFLLFFCCF